MHNTLADSALRGDLTAIGAQVFPGHGGDQAGVWPPEPSYFIAGLERRVAQAMARHYGQYAMLWIDADGMVELVEVFELEKSGR